MEPVSASPVFTTGRVGLGAISKSDAVEIGGASLSKTATPVIGHFARLGLPIATGALALISLWDHRIEKKRIMRQYSDEIATRTGKPESEITIDDMELVAKENPVIGEALQRSKTRRNLSVGVVIVGGIAAIALVAFLAPHIAALFAGHALSGLFASAAGVIGHGATGAKLGELLATGLSAGLGFLAIERPLSKAGEKALGLKEPELEEVKRNPLLQTELSVPSQITYLSHMQAKGQRISQEQVMAVFAAAHPEMGALIEARFGVPFDQLPPGVKTEVVRQLGAQLSIPELTQDINNRHLRVQELAFAVSGQSSGIKSVGDIQRTNVRLQKRVNELTAKLNRLYAQPRTVRNAPAQAVVEEPQQTNWGQRILAERQQQAKAGMLGA